MVFSPPLSTRFCRFSGKILDFGHLNPTLFY
nr:MAG TPA: hypothetical protein [Bacteriophage sp.]